ncbi:MAG: hypothetical protein WCF12_16310 [Propionicimonas sp.]
MTEPYQNPRWPTPEAEEPSAANDETIPLVPAGGFSTTAWAPWTEPTEATLLDLPLDPAQRPAVPVEPVPTAVNPPAELATPAAQPVLASTPTYQQYPASPYQPQQPQPWPTPAPAYRPEHPNAAPTLALALLGLFSFGLTCPFAWGLGARGRAAMRREPGRWRPSAMLTIGMVIGIIGSLLWLLVIGLIAMIVLMSS